MKRHIESEVSRDLQKKMVFLGGPRQVGKTTLARNLLATVAGSYFNWDYDDDRQAILKKRWRAEDTLLVFDELHKFPRWKSWIKGVYDVEGAAHQFLVTGSARLDVYRQGGDSLLGRYHYWRLHPLTLDELPPGI
ncbi:AAA family ATPase, partial [Myxococcota bacterium]|nr:AAA family ATPase [Myxococcota bacterium]MBU1511905.1 AAA family ATPase [Myxococcota bacterium]